MAKKQSVVVVSGLDNDPKVVAMTVDQESAFKETTKLLNDFIQADLNKVKAKEVAIAKLVALGLTEEDIKAVTN